MEIYKHENEEFNFDSELIPLFKAMEKGEVISEINFIDRVTIKLPEYSNFTNFKADSYFVAMQQNFDGSEKFDYVVGEDERAFYMNWIKSFKL